MRTTIGVILLTAISLASDAPKKGASEAEKAKLHGGWHTTDYKSDGDMDLTVAAPGGNPDLIFDGDNLILYGYLAGRYTIDATKTPKTIDLIFEKGAPAGTTDLGIYRLEDEVLTICTAEAPGPRPDDFTVPKGSNRRLTTYKRKP